MESKTETLSDTKTRLENEKLSLEIDRIKKAPDVKIQFINSLLTFLILIISVYSANFLTHLYDIKSETIALKREKLDIEVTKFENKRDSIQTVISNLTDSLTKIYFSSRFERQYLLDEFAKKEDSILKLSDKSTQLNFYKKQYDSLKSLIINMESSKKTLEKTFEEKLGYFFPTFTRTNLLDSIKIVKEREGYTILKEASIRFESLYEMPIVFPTRVGKSYQLIFIPDEKSEKHTLECFNWNDELVFKIQGSGNNITKVDFVANTDNFSTLKIYSQSKSSRTTIGYFLFLTK